MKKISYILTALLVSLVFCSAEAFEKSNTTQELVIDSQIMGEARRLVVYLPDDYENGNAGYPVLYITDSDVQGPHTAGTLDYLAKFDQTPHMIVVGIVNPRDTRTKDLTLVANDKMDEQTPAGADRFLAFIEEEVIPVIKSQYRTLSYQAISGTSHGGQFAINALLKKPGLFQGVIAISPTLYWNMNQLIELSEMALKKQQLKGRLFVSIANEEPTMTTPFEMFKALTEKYTSKNFKIKTQRFDQETHNTTVLLGQYYGLKHLFSDWAIPETPQTLSDLQANFEARSKLLNIEMVIPEDRASGFGQWLQYLGRKEDALSLLKWNMETYPQSLNAHKTLIMAYLHFQLFEEARVALDHALDTIKKIDSQQEQTLKNLLTA